MASLASPGTPAEIDTMTFTPWRLKLTEAYFDDLADVPTAPQFTPFPGGGSSTNDNLLTNYTSVGQLFAVNARGKVNKLRYYQNAAEAAHMIDYAANNPGQHLTHRVRLWKVLGANTNNIITSVTQELPPGWDTSVPYYLESASTVSDDWIEWDVTNTFKTLEPGLYMTSVDVYKSYSFSRISALGPARPSLTNVVAGTYGQFTTTAVPKAIFFQENAPDGYFWLDVLFTPTY